ncbi:PLC-like phosphodiesterase [Epithele typhae]|uniref:PLC-like phosphodiesterase n=1 Tax=Epithele typhae TaxID=378194 RepID=UPI0020085C17|nr:PLC-like phosphodiesterase [Epithele typhae]KAH9915793.1 PLC-like phosphodiesterase [Epithele typhae]
MAFYGWPISQCQDLSNPLIVQLNSGIRVLDVRLAVLKGELIAFHGVYPQRALFQHILRTLRDFLSSPLSQSETVVMSIKQEDFATTPLPTFSKLVHDEIMNGPGGRDLWFLENRIPRLGEVRGKIVMLSRFGGDGSGWERGLEGLGIHPTAWPDSAKSGFSWTLKGALVRTHDWYSIPSFLSIPEKTRLASEVLLLPAGGAPPFPVLNITFFSAASFPLAFPPMIARGFGWPGVGFGVEGVNARLGRWLTERLAAGTRVRGWAFLDFYSDPDDSLVPLLVQCNFKGRKQGEEGWE